MEAASQCGVTDNHSATRHRADGANPPSTAAAQVATAERGAGRESRTPSVWALASAEGAAGKGCSGPPPVGAPTRDGGRLPGTLRPVRAENGHRKRRRTANGDTGAGEQAFLSSAGGGDDGDGSNDDGNSNLPPPKRQNISVMRPGDDSVFLKAGDAPKLLAIDGGHAKHTPQPLRWRSCIMPSLPPPPRPPPVDLAPQNALALAALRDGVRAASGSCITTAAAAAADAAPAANPSASSRDSAFTYLARTAKGSTTQAEEVAGHTAPSPGPASTGACHDKSQPAEPAPPRQLLAIGDEHAPTGFDDAMAVRRSFVAMRAMWHGRSAERPFCLVARLPTDAPLQNFAHDYSMKQHLTRHLKNAALQLAIAANDRRRWPRERRREGGVDAPSEAGQTDDKEKDADEPRASN